MEADARQSEHSRQRYPLIGPVAAIAAGIMAYRFAPVPQFHLLLAIAAFLLLGSFSFYRRARILAGTCCLLGFFFAGELLALVHRPGPPPELDVEGREIVILGGCVVEPPAISGERERFLLELAPRARAQVTLYTKEGESLPPLRYGQNIEVDARVRKTHNYGNPGDFDYQHFLARQEIYFKKFFTLDELGESIENVTEDDVQRIAREFFEPKSIALTILGNLDGFKISREELAC